MLLQRLLTAAVLLPVFVAALFLLPNLYWGILLACISLWAAWEWGRLAGYGGVVRAVYCVVIAGSCVAILAWENAADTPRAVHLFARSARRFMLRRCVLAGYRARLVVPPPGGAQSLVAGHCGLAGVDAVLASSGVAAKQAVAVVSCAGCGLAGRYGRLFRRAAASAATSWHPRSVPAKRGKACGGLSPR